jgi:P4 family phage/plasmid primase-like protien
MNTEQFDPYKEFGESLRRERIPVNDTLAPNDEIDGANVPVIISLSKRGKVWETPELEPPKTPIRKVEYIEPEPFTLPDEPEEEQSEYEPEVILPTEPIEVQLPPTESVMEKEYEDLPGVADDLSLPDFESEPIEEMSPTVALIRSKGELPMEASTAELANLYNNSFKFRLLPIKGGTKIPAIPWRLGEEAEFTPAQYKFYWDEYHTAYGIGMRADGYFVIDVDMNREKEKFGDLSFLSLFGDDAIERLMDHTLWQVTGGGGLQFFFKLSPDIAPYLNNSSDIFGDEYKGIDCRYDTKGITVLPPSIHPSGIAYKWGNLRHRLAQGKDAIQTAPEWFAQKVIEARVEKVKKNTKTRYRSGSVDWRGDSDLVFDVESFDEVKEIVFDTVKHEAESRESSGFAHARVDSYDGSERLAIYASKNGIIGDWKMHPKTEVLLALGIDPRVWLLQFDQTDHHFVQAFYYYFGHKVLYTPEIKSWAILQDDLTWAFSQEDSAVYSFVQELVDDWLLAWRRAELIRVTRESQDGVQKPKEEESTGAQKRGRPRKKQTRGEKMIQWLLGFRNGGSMARIFDVMKKYSRHTKYAGETFHETLVRGRAEFDTLQEHEFPANNGVVNLKTKELRPYQASDFITTKSVANYNPDAKVAPFVQQAAWWVGGDLELLNYVQKVAGYGITADTSEAKLFILFGEDGRNGKSTLMDLMSMVLGDTLVKPTNLSTLTNERESGYALAEAAASRLMTIREGSFRALNTMVVKFVTGDKTIVARPIYGKPFSFIRKFKLWMATNTMPTITDLDGGLQRRLTVIPFTQIPESVVNLRFFEEWSKRLDVILKWLVDGASLFYSEGISQAPKAVLDETEKQTEAANSASGYLSENWVADKAEEYKIVLKTWIYEDYKFWCQKTGELPVSNRQFYQVLRTRMKTIRESAYGGDKGFKGLKPKNG